MTPVYRLKASSIKGRTNYGSMLAGNTAYNPYNTPAVTSGLTHWYDGSDSSTMTVSSGNISEWNIKSPASGGTTVTQGTGARQPDLESSVQNGKSAVRFKDANLDNLKSTTQPTTGTGAFTVCIAGKSTDTNTDQSMVSWGTSNAVGAGWSNIFFSDEKIGGGYAGNRDDNYVFSDSAYNNTWFTIVTTGSGTSLKGFFQDETKKTKTTPSVNVSSNSEFFLGWLTNPWYETFGFDGYIGDVLIYNRVLTDQECTDMRDWLQEKWGI